MHVLAAWAAGSGEWPAVGRASWHVHDYVGARPATARFLRWSVRTAMRSSPIQQRCRGLHATLRPRGTGGRGAQRGRPAAVRSLRRPSRSRSAGGMPPAPTGTVRVGLVGTFGRWKGHSTFSTRSRALATPPVRAYVIGGALVSHGGQPGTASRNCGHMPTRWGSRAASDLRASSAADEAIRALDVVVHASTSPEPFGLVIAEAMACGRAVIVSDAGGAANSSRVTPTRWRTHQATARRWPPASPGSPATASCATSSASRRGRQRNAASTAGAWHRILRRSISRPFARRPSARPSRLQRQPLRRDRVDPRHHRAARRNHFHPPRIRAVLRQPFVGRAQRGGRHCSPAWDRIDAAAAQRCRGAARARRARAGRHLRSRHLSRPVESGPVRRRCSSRGLPARLLGTRRHDRTALDRAAGAAGGAGAGDLQQLIHATIARQVVPRRPVARRVRARSNCRCPSLPPFGCTFARPSRRRRKPWSSCRHVGARSGRGTNSCLMRSRLSAACPAGSGGRSVALSDRTSAHSWKDSASRRPAKGLATESAGLASALMSGGSSRQRTYIASRTSSPSRSASPSSKRWLPACPS